MRTQSSYQKKRFYRWLAILGIVLWFAETAYFGFNDKPENGLEGALDALSFIMIGWGIVGDLLSNLKITKHEYNNYRANKLIYSDQRTRGKTSLNYKAQSSKDIK